MRERIYIYIFARKEVLKKKGKGTHDANAIS